MKEAKAIDAGDGQSGPLGRLECRLTAGVLMLVAVGLFQWLAMLYAPGFGAPFVYDDLPNIVYNADFRAGDAVGRILGPHPASTQYDKRPVSGLVTYANYLLCGLNVSAYRAVNLLIHWTCALLAGATVLALFRAVGRVSTGGAAAEEVPPLPVEALLWRQIPRLVSVATAVLWAVHPVHATAVIYINQRQETLMTLFFLLSSLCLLMAGERPRRQGLWRLGAGVAAVLSLFSKENAAGLVVVLAALDRLYVAGSWKTMWRGHRVFWIGLGMVWAAALGWIATGSRLAEWDAIPALASPWSYFKTECRVVFGYFKLLFWPDPLIFAPVPRIAERWQDWLPYGLVLCALFGGLGMAALRRSWLWVPLLTILLVLGPTSSFIPVPLEPDFDYRMHLPAVAALALLMVAACLGLGRFRNSNHALWIAGTALGVALLALSLVTRSRSADYARPESIWLDTVRQEPENVKAWFNLAHILYGQKRYEEVRHAIGAVEGVNQILKLSWVDAELHRLAGMLALAEHRWPEALAEYAKASALLPARADLTVGRAQALVRLKQPGEALALLDALKNPRDQAAPAAALWRAHALLALGRKDEAIQAAALGENHPTLPPDAVTALQEWRGALRETEK